MVNRIYINGILVLVALVMTISGCDNGTTSGFLGDKALNGMWLNNDVGGILFKNGKIEIFGESISFLKGIYSTNNNMILLTITHVRGCFCYDIFDMDDSIELNPSKWYSKKEIYNFVTDDEDLEEIFSESSGIYSVVGDTLSFSDFWQCQVKQYPGSLCPDQVCYLTGNAAAFW